MTYRSEYKTQTSVVSYRASTNCDKEPSLSPPILVEKRLDKVISDNSPRVNGKLQIRQNELQRTFYELRGGPIVVSKTAVHPVSPLYSCSVDKVYSLFSYHTLVPTLAHESVDDAEYAALNSFYSKVRNSKFNAAQAYAERKQAIATVADRTRRLADLYRSLRRGFNPFNRQRCNSKNSANIWLEYSYGWVPLVNDVYGAFQFSQGEPPAIVAKSSQRRPILLEANRIQAMVSPAKMTIAESFNGSARVTVRANVVVNDPALAFNSEIGLTNPVGLAWELLPYSFVVDWFIPIGGWLNGLTDTLGLGLQHTSITRTVKGNWSFDGSVFTDSKVTFVSGRGTVGSGKWTLKERIKSVPPRPLPRLRNPLSPTHALSGLALLRQAFH